MRAVNLVPAEERRGAGGPGRSGLGAHAVLGVLAMLVVLMGAHVATSRSVSAKQAELAQVRQEAVQVQGQSERLDAYTRFAALRAKRVTTVRSLAASRFDWAHAMREVARVIPRNAWLTRMTGTTSPSVNLEGAGGQTGSLRSAVQAPAVEISGCTTSQAGVARMITRMRLVDGVRRVALASSEKAEGSGGDGSGGGDCRNGSARFPKFDLVVFFDPPAAAPATGAARANAAGGTP